MQTIRVYAKNGKLVISFTGANPERQLMEWLNGRSESMFNILR